MRSIDHAVRHDTDFHQFMLYTPLPGTPLYQEMLAQGRLKDPAEYHPGDIHGQYIFNYRHPHIPPGEEAEFMVRAFTRDFQVNGPSVLRIMRTSLAGWQRYKNHPNARVRRRFTEEVEKSVVQFSAAVWATKRYFRHDACLQAKMSDLLRKLYAEFGLKSRLAPAAGGPYVLWNLRREQRRLDAGWTYEPPTFHETNAPQDDAHGHHPHHAVLRQVAVG